MIEALELMIYPRDEDGDYIHPYNEYCIPDIDIDYWTECKRLTASELAAEFHSARADHAEASNHPSGTYWTPLGVEEDATADMAMKRATVFLRLASLPHHDEETL